MRQNARSNRPFTIKPLAKVTLGNNFLTGTGVFLQNYTNVIPACALRVRKRESIYFLWIPDISLREIPE